jgi:hypothetical protein
MPSLRAFVRLTAAERHVVIAALVLSCTIPASLHLVSLQRLLPSRGRRWLGRGVPPARIAALAEAAASRLPVTPSCLSRSLVTAQLLSWSGHRCDIVLAVMPPPAPFEAHAWVEVEGRAAGPPPDSHWAHLARWSLPLTPA